MEVKLFSVTEITRLIKGNLENNINNVWIDGEVSNLKSPSSGHLYFTLKDESSQIKVVLFRYQRRMVKCELKDGMRIVLHGKVTVYEPRGEYQVIADHVDLKGLGDLQKAFEQLKAKLSKEGLFDEMHKKPIPLLPKKIGIVTSISGAAIQDMLHVINRRFTNIHIIVNPVKVQGDGAAEEIVIALNELNSIPHIDVIIIGRGGGSIEDLWVFNEEKVARAIFKSKIPVISAVGHETDYTISDFVSDLRAPTPSSAAELVIKSKEDLKNKIMALQKMLIEKYENKIFTLRNHLNRLNEKKDYFSPIKKINEYQQRIDDLQFTIKKSMDLILTIKQESLKNMIKSLHYVSPSNQIGRLKESFFVLEKEMNKTITYRLNLLKASVQGLVRRLNSVSPLGVLERGFGICTTYPAKKLIKKIDDVNIGDKIDVRLLKGELICKVEDIL